MKLKIWVRRQCRSILITARWVSLGKLFERISVLYLVKMYFEFSVYFSTEDEAAIEAHYQRLYQESNYDDRFGGGIEMKDDISQQKLLPGVKWVL